jgi:hypothetical protein
MDEFTGALTKAPFSNVNVIEITAKNVTVDDIPQYIANLETYMSRLKEIHWSSDTDKVHILSDDIISELKGYQDELAEHYMGYIGSKFKIGFLNCACSCDDTTLPDLLKSLRADTIELYDVVSSVPELKGVDKVLNSIMDLINKNLYKETQK